MSFRTRLISFFVVIVVVPMIITGALVLRLISDSDQGKANARVAAIVGEAATLYENEAAQARANVVLLAHDPALLQARGPALTALLAPAQLARVVLTQSGHTVAEAGDPTAIASGQAAVSATGASGPPLLVTGWAIPAATFVRELQAPDVGLVVRSGPRVLDESFAVPPLAPGRGTVTVDGVSYREITQEVAGGAGAPVILSVLSNLAVTRSPGSSTLLAIGLIVAFLALALAFALLSSRALQSQITRFLHAARRLGGGDFSAPVPSEGHDDFAALAEEFNSMSRQLESRLAELEQERGRLRESVRRIGQTFASNLDRPALLELALGTAIDATRASCGRVSVRDGSDQPLAEAVRHGALDGLEESFMSAERSALTSEELGRGHEGDLEVLSAGLRPRRRGSRALGLITVARRGLPFTDDEADLLRSLAAQAALALENVDLHEQVSRQAVTDELTGLANHGRFQELLGAETEQVRRYHHSLGLIMVDLDNFKRINDTYGHQQGDVVLRAVSDVLRENSRDADWPARYGGEELALILPHTDLEGAYIIAERIREAIEALSVRRIDGGEPLRVTASVGVAAATDGDKDQLVARADGALYEAKRSGKNRTVRAAGRPAQVGGGG